MKKTILIILTVVLVVAAGIAFFYLCNSNNGTAYYTVVDNSRVTESTKAVSNGSGNYEYKLDAYDADGNIKTITFKTTRELREGAYLKLNVMPVRGVVNWEEVQYKDLPEGVIMMNNNFKNAVDQYISEHKDNFRNYITQTDLFDQSGSPDMAQVIKVAKVDAFRLNNMLSEKYIRMLSTPILVALKKQESKYVLYMLFFYYIPYKKHLPLTIAMLSTNDEIFKIYCKALSEALHILVSMQAIEIIKNKQHKGLILC